MNEEQKQILLACCKTFNVEPIKTEELSQEENLKANQIYSKFQAYILWSEKQIEQNQ